MNTLLDFMESSLAAQSAGDVADAPRLSKQLLRVKDAMLDGAWHTLEELARLAGCTTQSASARLRDLRKRKFGGYVVERKKIADAVYAYRLQGGT